MIWIIQKTVNNYTDLESESLELTKGLSVKVVLCSAMSDGYIEIDDDEDDFDDDLIIGDTSSGSDGSYMLVFHLLKVN